MSAPMLQEQGAVSTFQQAIGASGGYGAASAAGAGAHPGLFSEEEEVRERLEMAPEEIYVTHADVYGTHGDAGRKPSPPSSLSRGGGGNASCSAATSSWSIPSAGGSSSEEEALAALDEAVVKIPPAKKGAYLEALRQCPYELNADRRAAFLHREDFDAAAAARRLVRYWERKLELFGPKRCYIPLTLERALGDKEVDVMITGGYALLPGKDDAGRALIVVRGGIREMSTPREAVLRAVWYVFHCAMEDPETRKRGFILLLSSKGTTFSKFDPKLISAVMDLEKHYLPLRLRATHHCHPPQFLRAINPIVRYIVGRRGRSRLLVHGGSDRSLPEKLGKYGIAPDCLPRDYGGTLFLSHEEWLVDRLELERRRGQDAADQLGVLATAVLCAERRANAERREVGTGDEIEQTAKKMKESPPPGDAETSSLSVASPPQSEGMATPTLPTPQARTQMQAVDIQRAPPTKATDIQQRLPLPTMTVAPSSILVTPQTQTMNIQQQLPLPATTFAPSSILNTPRQTMHIQQQLPLPATTFAPSSILITPPTQTMNIQQQLPLSAAPSSVLNAPQTQTMNVPQQLPLSASTSSVLNTAAASNMSYPRSSAAVNTGGTVGGAVLSGSIIANQEQALVNEALLQLDLQRRANSLQRKVRSATAPAPSFLSSVVAANASGLGVAGVPVAAPSVPQSSLSVPAVDSLLVATGAADAATLQHLLAYAGQPGVASGIGARHHSQPAPNDNGINAETLSSELGAGVNTGAAATLNPSFATSSAGVQPTNPHNFHAALSNELSLQQVAAIGSMRQALAQSNMCVGQSMAATGPAFLQQGSAAIQTAPYLQQQQPMINPSAFSANYVDTSILHLVRGSNSVPELPPDSTPLRLPRILHVPRDDIKISAYQCLVRQQAEAFFATEEHVRNHARGRCKPIVLGQVGIRCRHCRGTPLTCSPRGSIYFPAELVGMYQTAQKMASLHLASATTPCPSMPDEVRAQFHRLLTSKSTVGGGKHYWAEAGRMIGLVDSPNGIRFDDRARR